jgi:hypothetical protein
MSSTKEATPCGYLEEPANLLNKLPNDCTLEDIQYHLYVLAKVQQGLEAAQTEGTIPQAIAEQQLSKWLIP